MIKLLYFSYALHKQKVLNLIAIFYFRFDKKFSRGRCELKFSSFWIFLHYGAHHCAVVFRSRQVIASAIERYMLFVLYFRITLF